MPLFHHDSTASSSRRETVPAPDPQPQRTSGGFFRSSSRHDRSPTSTTTTTTTTSSLPRNSNGNGNGTGSTRHGTGTSLLHRHNNHNRVEDPSISAAREQVVLAERAEHEADRALVAARQAVRDAKEHVKRLEREAAEEARLARVKQDQAKDISKRARPLGRFGH